MIFWLKKIQAESQEKNQFSEVVSHEEFYLKIAADLLNIAMVLTDIATTAAFGLIGKNSPKTIYPILKRDPNTKIWRMNAQALNCKPSAGKSLLEHMLRRPHTIEINFLPFESLRSKEVYAPHGGNIQGNIDALLKGILRHHQFSESQINMFDYIFHEVFYNARKYQSIDLGLVVDIPEVIKSDIQRAMKLAIQKEQKNKLPRNKTLSLIIEQHPEYIIFTILMPLITAPKLSNVHRAMTDLADKSAPEIIETVNGSSEGAGLGIPLTIQALKKFPGSYYFCFNEGDRGASKIMLKKPERPST